MSALLWKDLRAMRVAIGYVLVILIGVYLVCCLINLYALWSSDFRIKPWPQVLVTCAICSLLLELPAAAMFGGSAFAAERADRSAEFLAYLPISRVKMAASKALLALGVLGAVWLANLMVVWAAQSQGAVSDSAHSFGDLAWALVAICVCMFGIAWLCSAVVSSSGLAATAGICAPIVLVVAAVLLGQTLEVSERAVDLWFNWSCGASGVTGFLLGSHLYLRGVEP